MCYSVASTSMHIHSTPWSSRGHKETKTKKKWTTSVSHTILWLSVCSNRKMSARQEVTCTYLHHTTPLCFSSPPLCYLFKGRQHMGHTVPMRLQQNTATCLTWGGQQKPATWVHWQRADPPNMAPSGSMSAYCAVHVFKGLLLR